ncbi:MAG: class I SAM-dependent methyltransferase [Desulfovibrio sp.]|uniref:class I SAM-dependent methyltransferase n=1 Tax=Desulfovibrio sp. TaxID=885 RepID=UPI002586DB50|nr:class I SAM-dependent methyltransferase [Desulfovibrio sp.]MCD7983615.1 class I SAM-dependent methyltransferase [Desulfovibrio sp.]
MLTKVKNYVRDRWPFGHDLDIPPASLARLMSASGAEPWHLYAIQSRKWRRHVCAACAWLDEALPRNALIFEPGCGSGANLLWLAERGFRRLQGSDLSLEALCLCRDLAELQGRDLEVWRDDGMRPLRPPKEADAIISVNWLYHVPGASLAGFLATYRPTLRAGGLIACDVVDKAYDSVPGNRCHSDDLHLPEARRRPSEYTFRLDAAEVEGIARTEGFRVLRSARFTLGRPPRAVYLLQRVERASTIH